MDQTMISAATTLGQLQKQMDIISNNMANIDTNGFKGRDATFGDLLVQQFDNQPDQTKEVGRNTPYGIRIGVGGKIAQSQLDESQGAVKQTNRPLDVSFTKENQYLKVLNTQNGQNTICYTRDGNLSVSPVGKNELMLVNSSGLPILDENNKMITFQDNVKDYTITAQGQLKVNAVNGQSTSFNLGVVTADKPQFLEQVGDNLLGVPSQTAGKPASIITEMTGPLRTQVSMQQGALEASNVDMGKEMTNLLNAQRSYQFQSRAITMSDQMAGLVNSLR
jgi:flagellar basal-body rod protein FlgG